MNSVKSFPDDSQPNDNNYNPTIKVDEDTTKTPFVRHFTKTGVTFSCIYSDEKQIALVAVFSKPELLDTSRTIPVRLHSSCANSDILGSFDCDCRSQLLHSIDILRERNGVLIHLFQEGREAGIFAKYLGMYTMQSKGLNTYGAYRKLALDVDGRIYSLAFKILRNLGIKRISLLSNNPKKAVAFHEAGFSVTSEALLGEITPQNFRYLFSKFSEGQHKISELFPEGGDYYFCKTTSSVGPFRRTWILDGDDMLWEDNIVYMKIVDDFVKHCLPYTPQTAEQQIRQMIDDTEEKTIQEYGLGAIGFRQSLETVYELLSAKNNVIPRPAELLDSVVQILKNQPEVLTADVVTVLSELEKRGDGLILYTQGPPRIQFEKIARSGLAEYFHALCVVKFKDDSSLRRLQHDFNFNPGEFILVGNSLRSDIEPAIKAGLKAIHFNNPNSWHIQNLSKLEKSQYLQIDSLTELLELSI
ncbi:MAG: HAD hydrolase-like protein [Candidatus Taylorbacteria bacterium]|nr:HAD hydrolase-like protein [Candidatus Taylorbacteria bacterium]